MFWEALSWFGELYFFLLVVAFFAWHGQKKKAIGLTCLLVLESVLVMGMKLFFKEPRPAGAKEITYSFPSGHASKIGLLAGFLVEKRNLPFLLLLLLVGVSRVALGEHFWMDVIAGGAFGLILGFIFRKLWNRLPVMRFGRHHRLGFMVLSAIVFVAAVYVEFSYINYVGAVAGLVIGFLVGGDRESGKKVFASGVAGFIILLFFIYTTAGYTNFLLNFVLGLWISVLNSGVWEVLNRRKA